MQVSEVPLVLCVCGRYRSAIFAISARPVDFHKSINIFLFVPCSGIYKATNRRVIKQMTKTIKKLEKENFALKKKTEKSDVTIIELLDEVPVPLHIFHFFLLWNVLTLLLLWNCKKPFLCGSLSRHA